MSAMKNLFAAAAVLVALASQAQAQSSDSQEMRRLWSRLACVRIMLDRPNGVRFTCRDTPEGLKVLFDDDVTSSQLQEACDQYVAGLGNRSPKQAPATIEFAATNGNSSSCEY
jgi:hypothetical protein